MQELREVPLTLCLRYVHGFGKLMPYFEGLAQGKAMATRSVKTGRVWFPPRLICPISRQETEWIELPGTGHIVSSTRGPSCRPFTEIKEEACFLMVAMDGADNLALGRLIDHGDPSPGARIRLSPPMDQWAHPAQAGCFRLIV